REQFLSETLTNIATATAQFAQVAFEASDDCVTKVHELEVSKDAQASFERTYQWTIDKLVDDPGPITLLPGDSVTMQYTVTVNLDDPPYVDSPLVVEGTITINAGESMSVGEIVIQAFWSKPPQGDPAAGIAPPDVTHLGYVIEMEGLRLYVTGDAINTFADHDELIAPIAALKPDIGFLTTHPTEGEFPFFEDSVRLAQKLGLKTAVPAHYACFAKRTYDPQAWAALFPAGGPQPLIIPWNSHIVYSPEEPA
ncbi:MAG: MBL fold metallo-hydrolase, partial [Anaerolineae bacterium]